MVKGGLVIIHLSADNSLKSIVPSAKNLFTPPLEASENSVKDNILTPQKWGKIF